MRLFSTEAKVGVVVFTALAALTWLTFQIGEFRFREKGYLIEAVFRTVSGLEPKAKVRMAGVMVGSVDRIYLKEGRAHAQLRLDDGVVLREDSVVAVASIGILSERYVEITAGTQSARAIAPGSVLAGRELMDMDQLVGQLAETSKVLASLTASVSETFGGRESTVSQLMQNSSRMIDRVNLLLDENRRQISELLSQTAGMARETRSLIADNRDELHGTIANLNGTIANLREFSATLNRRADDLAAQATKTTDDLATQATKTADMLAAQTTRTADRLAAQATRTGDELNAQLAKTGDELRALMRDRGDDIKGLMSSLRAAADKSQQAAEALTSILKKVDAGTGTLGRLVNDDGSITKVDRAVEQFGGIAEKINSGQGSIGRLVTDDKLIGKIESAVDSASNVLGEADRIRLFLGYRGEFLTESSNFKNYVTMKFQPRDDKYYLLELVDDPAGRRSITHTSTTIDQPEGAYRVNENTVVTEEGKLKFSVEFAKDFGQLTFRGGLLESQGGAALDYRLFDDRLRLSFEGWDFSRAEGPHLKLSGRVKVYKDVFVNAGVDDLSEESYRSAFVGGGILFSDEDLKYLLSLARFSQ